MTLCLGEQHIELRPSGAVRIEHTLIVADVHLGKERAFRQQGVPVPEGPSADSLVNLSKDVLATGAKRLIFLGDLFHHQDAIAGVTFESLGAWLQGHPSLEAVLVKGNHDRIPEALNSAIDTVPSLSIGALGLFHHPQESDEPHLAGHLHPAITIRDGRRSERLRCFWRHGQMLVLPSFSEFTGCMAISPSSGDEVFVAVGAEIRSVPIA